ncbi:phage major capsid protein [Pedobacter cryoconitis]|uniref:HK97 family phage major capsid protein n=1 Tax=Pedobacter cryoconitis TaxID=188932 RepID=A0A327SK31_9SPHI|nr:phage major capsid protein [Pedobacter cryoconitis]RAJ28875.1 HK97 family phage major capsid protein [Pedobacter cryoconitis]
MTEEEKVKAENEALDKVKAAAKKEAESAVKKVKEDGEKALAEQKAEFDKKVAALEKANKETQDHANDLDARLQGGLKKEKEGFKSLNEALIDAFKAQEKEIKAIVDADGVQSASLVIEVKAAIDMGVGNTIGSGTTQVSITDNTNIISTIRRRTESYLASVTVGSTAGNRAMWIEETDEQGNPLFIGEGTGKPAASVRYVEKTAVVKKLAVYGKVTTEMLADLPQLISYIQNNLAKRLELKKEDGLFAGDNVGDNLNGVKNFATPFVAGGAAASIAFVNEFDVLDAVGTQVDLAFGNPNAVYIHPTTLQKMRAIKTTTGELVYKDYLDLNGGGLMVHNMKILPTTLVPVGEFLGGDMTAVNVLFREKLNIQIGLDGNDFTNNKKTILLEQRLVQFVSANDTQVIVKGTFATALAALNKPAS